MNLVKVLFFFFASILFAQEINIEQSNQDAVVAVGEQDIDTLKLKDLQKSPLRASLYSAILPGAGQVYNKKLWKVPIVWGLLGAGAGVIIYYNSEYNRFRSAFTAELNGEVHEFTELGFSAERLATLLEDRRRIRDYAIAVTSLIYLLNILDATVDAHLFEFDKNPDVSWKWEPSLQQNPTNANAYFGVKLQLNF